MTYTERALQLRPVIEKASQSLDDSTALTAMELFPKWKDLVQTAAKVVKGFRFQHNGKLWRIEQPEYIPAPPERRAYSLWWTKSTRELWKIRFLMSGTWKSMRACTTPRAAFCIGASAAADSLFTMICQHW